MNVDCHISMQIQTGPFRSRPKFIYFVQYELELPVRLMSLSEDLSKSQAEYLPGG